MSKVSTYLWFDTNLAEEAANYYTSIIPNSRVVEVTPMLVTFELDGQQFSALNGGPNFTFTDAISLYVDCADQDEVDALWARFIDDGGKEGPCGWLKDKFGLSWQIIPRALTTFLSDQDPVRAERAQQAMFKMTKINLKEMEDAVNG